MMSSDTERYQRNIGAVSFATTNYSERRVPCTEESGYGGAV